MTRITCGIDAWVLVVERGLSGRRYFEGSCLTPTHGGPMKRGYLLMTLYILFVSAVAAGARQQA